MYDAWLDEHVDYHDPDENENEWVDDAENEPTSIWRLKECVQCGCEFETAYETVVCPSCVNDAENEPTDEELAEWARALMEEEESWPIE